MKRARAAVFRTALAMAVLAGCGKQGRFDLPPPTPARIGSAETGMASWYGHPYHGRRTSSGEVYDMDALTAAHLSLPFDTVLRVTNLDNGRSVDVRVNDRGPFVKKRLVDVSREAARRLDMLGPGTARVRAEVVATPAMHRAGASRPAASATTAAECAETEYAVQVGAFRDPANARTLRAAIAARFPAATVRAADIAGEAVHRVLVPAPGPAAAAETLAGLRADGADGFVARQTPPLALCLP